MLLNLPQHPGQHPQYGAIQPQTAVPCPLTAAQQYARQVGLNLLNPTPSASKNLKSLARPLATLIYHRTHPPNRT